jgi:hypothetical protein
MEAINRWIGIVAIVGIILLMVHPRSKAKNVIMALTNESIGNIKALQANAPS